MAVKNVNTVISYALRIVVALHICFFGILYIFFNKFSETVHDPNNFDSAYLSLAATALVALLLLVDWFTPKEQSRLFSKLIDSIIGIGWVLTICALTLWPLSMGMP